MPCITCTCIYILSLGKFTTSSVPRVQMNVGALQRGGGLAGVFPPPL